MSPDKWEAVMQAEDERERVTSLKRKLRVEYLMLRSTVEEAIWRWSR